MGLIKFGRAGEAPSGSSRDSRPEIHPEGLYPARFVDIIDWGEQDRGYGYRRYIGWVLRTVGEDGEERVVVHDTGCRPSDGGGIWQPSALMTMLRACPDVRA